MLGMSIEQIQTMCMECSLCGQVMYSVDSEDKEKIVNGAELYAYCPACDRSNEAEKNNKKWRRKVDRYFKKQAKQG